MPLGFIRGDITAVRADAVVNAANPTLLGGGGVDGAIHRAAGPQLREYCARLGGCRTGQAVITPGFGMSCRYIIHTVGPVWYGGCNHEEELLKSCYRNSLRLAKENGARSVVFPLISAGAYGYPRDQAILTAKSAIREFLDRDSGDGDDEEEMQVTLCFFDRERISSDERIEMLMNPWSEELSASPPVSGSTQPCGSAPGTGMLRKRKAKKSPGKTADLERIPLSGIFSRIPEQDLSVKEAPGENELRRLIGEDLRSMDIGFAEALLQLIDASGMTDAECYHRANVDRKLFNKIKNVPGYHPKKYTVLAFAAALKLDPEKTGHLLSLAGYALSGADVGDRIVSCCFRNGIWDVDRINALLFDRDQELLGSFPVTV